ncbi:MAG: 50S ribosomal protein L11 methyltransferase [Lachnospiraceae bacterium]|nr:50S ribosomal protein L11 methyltransferase [Lachnospiraceae bacterium]
MKWNVFTVSCSVDAEDYVCAALSELGFDSLEIMDSVPLTKEEEAAQFIDIPPELDETDRTARICCYTGEDDAKTPEEWEEEILAAVREYEDIVDLGDLSVAYSVTEDVDWINNWKQYFHAFRIGEDILIRPSWEKADEKPGDTVIEIDPGTAFGTGSHETTWLCIEALRGLVKPGMNVLDVGCGSGILSIAAKKFGASCCIGIDIDPIAVDVSKENAENNGLTLHNSVVPEICDGTVSFYAGDVISDEAAADSVRKDGYEVVVANILADIIIPLAPVAKTFLRDETSTFVCSGILKSREADVRKALTECGLTVTAVHYRNDWTCLEARLVK